MDIRIEAFNLFNRVIWGAPNTDFSSNNFGLINSQAQHAAADADRAQAVPGSRPAGAPMRGC